MASGKKSFILYTELIHIVKKLPMEKRGELFTVILEYVNDLNPIIDESDLVLDIAFEQVKQRLKADLVKYEERAERSRENGAKGGRPRKPKKPSGFTGNPDEPKKPDNDTVTVNDTVNDNVSSDEDYLKPIPFDEFWKLYGKEIGLIPCQREWSNIDEREYPKILEHVPKFVKASGKYLKKPENYLKDRCWMDNDLPNYSEKESKDSFPKTIEGLGLNPINRR